MENFENTNMDNGPVNDTQDAAESGAPRQEPVYVQPVQEQTYHNAGVGRKESPFADSPYVMNHNQQTYQAPPAQPQKPKAKKAGKRIWKNLLAAVLAIALVAAGCGITAFAVNSYWEDRTEQLTEAMNDKIAALEKQITAADDGTSVSGSPLSSSGGLTPSQVYAQNVRSVVLINCTVVSSAYGQTTTGTSSGSGFVLTEDGYVATNCHVVEGASSISVTMYDGTEYAAQLVGSDSVNDLAVLKMDASGLDAVTIGSSSDLIVGDQVVAIGNPLGELTSTLTAGYVSAKDRDVTTDGTAINMLQTDAAINSGNSGGPLFNMNGEVVGITTAKYSGTSSSGATIEGIGFAIPIDDVIGMIEDLTNYGYITGAYLGVMVSDMDAAVSNTYGLPMGAYVQEATKGYCAEAAGVQAKDIIVELGGYEIENISDLTRALRNFKGGDVTTITVYRGGAELTLTITLDEKPRETAVEDTTTEQPSDEYGGYSDPFGFWDPFFGGGNG